MLARLLEMPLVDVLLILLLLRIFFPSLFGVRRKRQVTEEKKHATIHYSSSQEKQKHGEEKGEYIDYEEIK